MKKIIVPVIVMMLSATAFGEKKMKPTSYLKGKAQVYKIMTIEKKDGTLENEIKQVCQKEIMIPTFKLDTSDASSGGAFGSDLAPNTCFGTVMGEDVTIAFDAYHMDALILPGKIAKEQGLSAWINSRANGIIGMACPIPRSLTGFRGCKSHINGPALGGANPT